MSRLCLGGLDELGRSTVTRTLLGNVGFLDNPITVTLTSITFSLTGNGLVASWLYKKKKRREMNVDRLEDFSKHRKRKLKG